MEKQSLLWLNIKRLINNDTFVAFLESFNSDTIFICGGCIRSILIDEKKSIKDIDLFVNMNEEDFFTFIEDIKSWGAIDYGQYGSPRLFFNDRDFYIDIVPFSNFTVSSAPILSVDDLLANFDFTANAIGIDVVTKRVINTQNGIQDIHNKILRAVRLDFPEKNVSKDIPLSAVSSFWFRLLHYQKKLNFVFSPETKKWILKNRFRYRDLQLFKRYFFDPQVDKNLLKEILYHD